MHSWLSRAGGAHVGLCAVVTLFAVACAEGTVEFEGKGGDNGSGNQGGFGAQGGSGGGQGGDTPLPCGIDCSMIMAPTCLKSVCNEGQYVGPVGSCVVVDDDAGAMCDDGMFCTAGDTCNGMGDCLPGPANDCGMTAPACQQVQCNEASQSCSLVPGANGTFCTPTDLCLVNATCLNGSCSGGTPKDCFFAPVPNECYVAVCDPADGQCKPEPDPNKVGFPCNDASDLCTVGKTCDVQGNCSGGQPKNCSQLTQGCQLGVCDTMTGNCIAQQLMNGDPCDDLNGCSSGETCQNGQCTGGVFINQCINNDNCCPPQCNINNDNNCQLCGNMMLEVNEEADPPPGPSVAAPLNAMSCRYDFSNINQWYCNGTCGNWGGPDGCDQADADAFCKLKMDNPLSTATTFQTTVAFAAPGVCCPPPSVPPGGLGCANLGILSSRGVMINVSVNDTSVVATHGAGSVITNLVCTDP
jgi:hypothetical protein